MAYGVSSTGFVPASLMEVKAQIESDLKASMGASLDLSSTSLLGNLTGIMANAYADLWAAGADLYSNQFPAGASGVAVDNLLAINNLSRLPAVATITDPNPVLAADGTVRHGFVLFGTPGTSVPAGSLFTNGAAAPVTFALNAGVTIGVASNGSQVVYLYNRPTSGAFSLSLTAPSGVVLTTPSMPWNAQPRVTTLSWASAPTAGTFQIGLDAAQTTPIQFGASAADVQAAIVAVPGFAGVTVAGAVGAVLSIMWPAGYVPRVTSSGVASPSAVVDAIAGVINGLAAEDGSKPFTDVLVSGTQQAISFAFGAFAPASSAPSTAAAAIPKIAVASNSLFAGQQSTGITPQVLVSGNPAMAVGQATCTTTGPQTVVAGQLATIVTPINGLNSVTNQLDCITGRNVESDTEALARLKSGQGSGGSGSLAAIINRVGAVSGVTQVVGAQNLSNAAEQVLLFGSAPTSGSFNLLIAGQVTPLLAYTAGANDIQAAIRGLAGFSAATVTTSGTLGFVVDFGASGGGQSVPLMQVPTNTTGQSLTAYFGRVAHSIELTVQGGADVDIANAILAALPAGVSTYSSPLARTTASMTAGSAVLTVQSAEGIEVGQAAEAAGLPLGAQVAALSNSQVTLSTVASQTANGVPIVFDTAQLLADAAGNPVLVSFSRPVDVVIYLVLSLVTDMQQTPGDPTSGANPASRFDLGSVEVIRQRLIDTVNATQIGGTVNVNGSLGLLNSFRDIPGVVSASLTLGRTPSPTQSSNISLSANEAPTAQSFSCEVDVQ